MKTIYRTLHFLLGQRAVLPALAIVMIHPTAVAAVRYVDAQVSGGAGDGSSWANAYTKLQDALAASSSGDNIRVARGVYYPDEGSGQTNNASTSTFTLKDGVNLYGGFENGQSFSQRDPAANLTILSGDLQQDDTNTDGNFIAELSIQKSGTNALHVVTGAGASTSVVFDGFVVTAGSSGGSGSGGGMMLDGSPTTVVDCQFFGNSGANAGAVSTNSAASTFEGCYFHGNVGVFNCGAVSAVGTSATFKDCLFERNSSPAQGGALRVGGGDIYNCRFVKNFVSRTQATGVGSAVYATGSINMGNCVFYNNSSNTGTVYLTGGSGATIANCTFSGNSATADAGALYFASVNGPRTVTHCIAWNNETAGSQIFVDTSGSIPTYRHCLIEGWNPAGIGNLDGTDPNNAPIFISPATPGASNVDDVNLRMMANSPTINRGDVSELDKDHADLDGDLNTTEKLPSDFDGKDRNLLGVPDLGAYESSSSVIHVDASVIGGTGSGIGWANAYSALAAALEDAQDGQQIWVAAGVYLPSVGNSNASGINDKSVSFELKNGVALYGGFAGDELALTDRDFGKNKSILSGDVDGNDGADQLDHFSQIVGTNSLHVVTSNNTDNTARIDGFIITAGQASTVTAGTLNNQSGGMLIENSHATIRNCQFTGNSTLHGAGGGFHCRGGSKPSLVNCVFRGNGALLGGAIMISSSSNATLVNCTVTRNETQSTSMNYANIYISGATASLENCIVWDNSVANASGSLESINLNSASCTIRESIVEHSFNAGVWNSSVGTDGGGNLDEDPKFVSLTDPRIHYNSPAIDAGNNMADLDRSNLGNLILEDEISTDVKGHTRVADSDLNFGAIVDMGAFEYQGRKVTDTDDDGMSDFFELVNTQPSSPTLLLPNQDPDGDNKSNLVESVFGSNTNEFDKDYPLSLHQTTSPAASYLKLTFPYNPDSANFVDLYWEYSENLSNWDGIDGALSPAGGGLYQFISNRDVSGRSKGFIRFVVKKK